MAAAKGDTKVAVFDCEEDVAVALAKYIADLSDKCAKEKGVFSVVLSGGSLIDTMRKLVEQPFVDTIDWSKWHVVWLDERVVRKNDSESNYKLAYDGFFCKVQIPPNNIYAINDELPAPEDAADDYEACLKTLVEKGIIELSKASGFPKFDLMLVGMGPDGHVASLFPRHPLLQERNRWVTYIKDSPKPPPERITFTFPVINSSANIALVLTGPELAHAVHIALGNQQTSSDLLPVQMVSPEGKLTWFLDQAAASKIKAT
ncbi:6-phosphogluconolactonase [Actinidia chinensis var. chinensis]|uniref:Probable 6-phosphogluconolactonase n=1 Tax=Actinidia chinensis var. chinensis TaxID=1590841 RepID=A0A2R6PQN6_ACTCC|nr:6-phosphogluconolactonase [Actinidia chinensis var. chinensis]